MEFPFPLRSFISTMDYSTPLFVDTNILYQMDETKFPGLQEGSHCFEPSLIIDSGIPLNSKDACAELTDATKTAWDDENQDLYNLIDSLDVEDMALFPIESVDILDLPDIPSEHLNDEIDGTSSFEPGVEYFPRHMDSCVAEKSLDCLDMNRVKFLEQARSCDAMLLACTNADQQTASCLSANTSSRQKRRLLSEGDKVNCFRAKEPVSAKRRKLDQNELSSNSKAMENVFERPIDNSSQISYFSEFCLYDSPITRCNVRQC